MNISFLTKGGWEGLKIIKKCKTPSDSPLSGGKMPDTVSKIPDSASMNLWTVVDFKSRCDRMQLSI